MITFATAQMAPALQALWCECFFDTPEYSGFFYKNRFKPEETLVDVREGRPVAMLSLLPATIQIGEASQPVWYVYAVATAEAWRGQGISTALLQYVQTLAHQQNDILTLLVPAKPELFAFYRTRGYQDAFSVRHHLFPTLEPSAQEKDFVYTPLSPRMYHHLRNKHFTRDCYVSWEESAISYVLRENELVHGMACMVESPSGRGLALCYKKGDVLLVKETTLPEEEHQVCFSKIARKLGCSQMRVRLAANGSEEDTPFAMSNRPLPTKMGYLNLVLD